MSAPTDLNDYHKQQEKRLTRNLSQQQPMLREESIEQFRRLREQRQRTARVVLSGGKWKPKCADAASCITETTRTCRWMPTAISSFPTRSFTWEALAALRN